MCTGLSKNALFPFSTLTKPTYKVKAETPCPPPPPPPPPSQTKTTTKIPQDRSMRRSHLESKDFVLVQSYLGLGEPWRMPGHLQWWTGSHCFHGDRSWMGWDTPPRNAYCLHTSSSWWRGSTMAWAARTYLHSLYIPPHFVHTCTVCTYLHSSMYQHSLYIPVQFYVPAQFVHTCALCIYLHSLYTPAWFYIPAQFVHTCTVCTWLHSSYTPVQFIYTCTVCTYLHSL